MPFFGRKEPPIIKKIKKLRSAVEKGKKPPSLEIKSREEIITTKFEEAMHEIGLNPSEDSGYIPTSQTPLARYLRKYKIPDDIIDAVISGVAEAETAQAVRDIIDAAADSPKINLEGIYLGQAMDLAVEEWERRRKGSID